MRRVLVTAIGGNVANGVLKVLQETEAVVFGCNTYDYPVGMDKVKDYWISDAASSPNYIPNLLRKCKGMEITHLIPINEFEIQKISEHREAFQNSNIKVLVNAPQIIDMFLDKYRTAQYLKECGLEVPRTYTVDTFREDGETYIVKYRNSCGSKLIEKVKTINDIQKLGVEMQSCIIQEYLPDEQEEYTVGLYSNGEEAKSIIFRRKLEHGYTSFVELSDNQDIDRLAKKVAKSVGLRGYLNLQLRKAGDAYKIFEINPRISGTVYFRHLLGFQDVLWWLDLLDGRMNFSYVPQYKKAIGMRELTEKFVVLE